MSDSFKKRLKGLILKGESIRSFALRCGLSDSTIRHYLAETSEPTLGKIEQIAQACNVSVGWLAAGEKKDGARDSLDKELLVLIALLIEDQLKELKASLPTAKKMELICFLYDDIERNPQHLYKKTKDLVGLLLTA
jgi:transcriptional regulator with XRE-family HTH domain